MALRKKTETNEASNKPGWLNIKNIIAVVSLIIGGSVGGGLGYNAKEPEKQVVEKPVVEAFDIKNFADAIKDNLNFIVSTQKEKDENQNKRTDMLFDEMRTNYSDFDKRLIILIKDVREIKRCLQEKDLLTQDN